MSMHRDLSIDFLLDKIEIEVNQDRKNQFVNELIVVSKALRANQKDAVALEQRIQTQAEELDNLEQGTNHLENNVEELEDQISRLKDLLTQAEAKIQELQTCCYDHEQREENLCANLEDEKAERGRAESQVDNLTQEIKSLKARNQELERELDLI